MPKKQFDRLDAEAEREGNARARMQGLGPRILGKRILGVRRMHAAGARMIQTKIERRHT